MALFKSALVGEARKKIRENSTVDATFFLMNGLATVIAAYGLLGDNATSVIGAMIVATMIWKVNGVSLALVEGDAKLLGRSLAGFSTGALLVLSISVAIGFMHREIPLSHEILARTHPTLLDLSVAFFSGAAGTVAIISPGMSAALVGIAISTAIVPPMAAAGLLIARGSWHLAGGAGMLVLVNIVAIQLATSLVLWVCGVTTLRKVEQTHRQVLIRNVASLAIGALLLMTLLDQLRGMVKDLGFEAGCKKILSGEIAGHADAYVADVRFEQKPDRMIVRAVVRSVVPFTADDVRRLEASLPATPSGLPIELRVRNIPVIVMTRDGELFERDVPAGEELSRKPSP